MSADASADPIADLEGVIEVSRARLLRDHERRACEAAHAAGCEVCGEPARWIVTRKRHQLMAGMCATEYDPAAPMHPRCSAHAVADAWSLDRVVCPHCLARSGATTRVAIQARIDSGELRIHGGAS